MFTHSNISNLSFVAGADLRFLSLSCFQFDLEDHQTDEKGKTIVLLNQ